MDGISKLLSFFQVRVGGFTPHNIRIRCICQSACNSLVNSCVCTVEAFWCALACDEGMVAWIDVACDQISCICIRTGDDKGWYTEYISCQSGCSQVSYRILSWKQYFAAQMSAFFL